LLTTSALGGEFAEAGKYFKAAGEYDRTLHANVDALSHFRSALDLGHPDRAYLLEAIGDIQTLLGEYEAALKSYQSASDSEGVNSPAQLEHKIGNVYQRQGEWEEAKEHYRSALSAVVESGDNEESARILADWSLVSYHCKDLPQAKRLALEALRNADQEKDEYAKSQVHNILGILARSEGDFQSAVAHLNQSLAIAKKFQDPGMRVAALNNLALVHNASNDLEQAIQLTEKALELCILQGDRHREAALHSNLADLLHKTGKNEAAIEHLKKSVVIFAEIGENGEDLKPEVWKLVDW
jgi:tetratricopeptide (TPR) repeat protein